MDKGMTFHRRAALRRHSSPMTGLQTGWNVPASAMASNRRRSTLEISTQVSSTSTEGRAAAISVALQLHEHGARVQGAAQQAVEPLAQADAQFGFALGIVEIRHVVLEAVAGLGQQHPFETPQGA